MSSILTAGALTWPVDSPCGPTGPDGCNAQQWTRAQELATEWLWVLSGRKYGLRATVFRPEWTIPIARGPWNYVLGGGPGYSAYGYGSGWGSSPLDAFVVNRPLLHAPLPGPVNSVTAVEVDGVVLPGSAWQVNGDNLLRVDGGQWYRYQDTTQPISAVGTWQITYVRGSAVPESGQYAAGVLACEEAKRMLGLACRLPNNTTQVQRTGTTVSLDAKQLQLGYTGLREVDQWCRLVNPKGRQSDPFVWSPDLDPGRLPPIPSNQST